MIKLFFLISFFLCPFGAQALSTHVRSQAPKFTYDLGLSSGTYEGKGYSEIQLGLSWHMSEYFVWRNSVFSRFGSGVDSATGLDSSARFTYDTPRDEQGFGIGAFAGPGYRFSNKENTGVFGEAGLNLKMGGISTGVAVKSIYYNSPGKDSDGRDKGRTDTVVSLVLAAGGGF
jgi:hypothetical protein